MSKRKVTKLFAVVALATSTPALAGPEHDHGREPRDPWTEQAQPASQPRPEADAPKQIVASMLTVLGIAVPRQLRTGAPACGNVGAKSPRRCE